METGTKMDCDSNFDFDESMSPYVPCEDTLFTEKHNILALNYQNFKVNVELTTSGNVALQDDIFINQLLQSTYDLYFVAETEKTYLMSEVLFNWAVKQQKTSIGTLWTQERVYQELNYIDRQFECFCEYLDQSLSGLLYLVDMYPSRGFEEITEKFKSLAHIFLYYSVIVAKQPPSVVVKCGEAENHRRSRFWFNTEIRMLGGRALGLNKNAIAVNVGCFLITDDTARNLLQNAYLNINENEDFELQPEFSTLEVDKNDSIKAKFDDMRVSKKGSLRRDGVAARRYFLCYSIQMTASYGIELLGKKMSLPFAILVGPKTDVEAKLFLERSFAELVRVPLSDNPAVVNTVELADALEMKFQAIVETPQKSHEKSPLIRPVNFGQSAKIHLIKRLKEDRNGQVLLENFLKLSVAEEYTNKKGTDEGEWKLIPFYEWFLKFAEIINKYLFSMWFQGLIYGFCGKNDAEQLLQSCHSSALLIRFSDLEHGKIKISVNHGIGVIKHHWYESHDLATRDLRKELLNNPNFAEIELIYPNKNLIKELGGSRELQKKQNHRNFLTGSDCYFENQGAARPDY